MKSPIKKLKMITTVGWELEVASGGEEEEKEEEEEIKRPSNQNKKVIYYHSMLKMLLLTSLRLMSLFLTIGVKCS